MVKNYMTGGPKKNRRPGFGELKRDRSRLKGEVCEKSDEIRELKETNVELERANEDLTASNQRLVPENDQLLRKVKEMDRDLEHAQRLCHDLDWRYHDEIDKGKNLEARLKREAQRLAEGRATILELRQTNESYRQSVQQMQSQIAQAQNSRQAQSNGPDKTSEEDRKTIEDLKAQIIQYKATISASTRGLDQVSDDFIKEKAGQIFFSLQNFVVQKFRGIKLSKLVRSIWDVVSTDGLQTMQRSRPT